MSKHAVEIVMDRQDGSTVINRIMTKDLVDSLRVAEACAHRLFPEDLEAINTFQNGVYLYWNVNDCGDEVFIRPIVEPVPSFSEAKVPELFLEFLKH